MRLMAELQPASSGNSDVSMVQATGEAVQPASPGEPSGDGGPELESGHMPAWTVGELPEPPNIKRGVLGLLGPGLMMAGAAIGGGEWLMGPAVTAQYGGIIMWLALISILTQ